MARPSNQKTPAPGVLALAAFLTFGAAAGAQNGGSPGPVPGAAPGGAAATSEVRFDGVRGIIGDSVILESTIDSQLRQRFPGRELKAVDRRREEGAVLFEIAQNEAWIQYGKILGQDAPEAFRELVEREVDGYLEDQESQYGSFTRMNEELEAIGSSWQSLRDDYRQQLLKQIAQSQTIGARLRENASLLVTPREMVRYYREHTGEFAARREATVARVFFPPRSDPEERRTSAAEAAAAWRGELATAKSIGERYGGRGLAPVEGVKLDGDDDRAAFLVDFARRAGEGEVSEPLEVGRNLFVLKVVYRLDQPARPFEEQSVQDEIRTRLANLSVLRMRSKILWSKLQNLYTWPPELFERGR